MLFWPTSNKVSVAWLVATTPLLCNCVDSIPSPSTLPIVDLGYQLHQAQFNPTGGYYNFSNIRYAAPPVGALRFRAPQSPATDRSAVHQGLNGRVCPQAVPNWYSIPAKWVPAYVSGQSVNISETELEQLAQPSPNNATALEHLDPRISEDCLFLDVLVPQGIMPQGAKQARNSQAASTNNVPVVVWIFGGGYTSGDKTMYGAGNSPEGLLRASTSGGKTGIIFVAINYRLGAFGWLSGSAVEADGIANAGLLDQRLALDWVQKNIHLFGGDSRRVTVMGQSAGGGSIMHHITSYGGQGPPLPFQQAIAQSPAFMPTLSQNTSDSIYANFLTATGTTRLNDTRHLASSSLILANAAQVADSIYGTFTYGPAIDGSYVPATPVQLLAEGRYHKGVKLLVSKTSDEGLLFSNPSIQSQKGFETLLEALEPGLHNSSLSALSDELYPPIYNGSYGYRNPVGRQAAARADLGVNCNWQAMSSGLSNETISLVFAVPPALHGQDLPYTFYNGSQNAQGPLGLQTIEQDVAQALQELLVAFAGNGDATSGHLNGTIAVLNYGNNHNVLQLNVSGFVQLRAQPVQQQCQQWQSLLGS